MLGLAARRAALLLLLGAAAVVAGGCHSGGSHNPVEQKLERADLVLTAQALEAVTPLVESEAQATKAAWPHVVNGLNATDGAISRLRIHEADQRAEALPFPALFGEERARGLTGPASPIAGTYANFDHLATRGWRSIDYSAEQIAEGSPAAKRFAEANVALYIESVYDAHFALAQIGKKLVKGYEGLGGESAFGTALTQAEVQHLAEVYSEAHFRLEPHAGVRLGS